MRTLSETPATIRQFWFGDELPDSVNDPDRARLWWSKDPHTDGQIRDRFEDVTLAAAAGDLTAWEARPEGLLALILVTDQMPRNMYRGKGRAFAFDALALAWCLRGLEDGWAEQLAPIERVFFYLPLEHAESLEHQHRSVALFEGLVATAPPGARAQFERYLDYARRHLDIIERFGRFPHRNDILGRESTVAEREFLTRPGSAF